MPILRFTAHLSNPGDEVQTLPYGSQAPTHFAVQAYDGAGNSVASGLFAIPAGSRSAVIQFGVAEAGANYRVSVQATGPSGPVGDAIEQAGLSTCATQPVAVAITQS